MEIEFIIYIILFLIFIAIFGLFLYANLPIQWTLGGELPTVSYLAEANLLKIDNEKNALNGQCVKAEQLFAESPLLIMVIRRPGCGFCRQQASELKKLTDYLTTREVKLIGVVHETLGIDEFRDYLKGDVYYDEKRQFFGPQERWMPRWMGYLRLQTYSCSYKMSKDGFKGNNEGEGCLLGGIYLINKNNLLYGHLEDGWGDLADVKEIIKAVKQIH